VVVGAFTGLLGRRSARRTTGHATVRTHRAHPHPWLNAMDGCASHSPVALGNRYEIDVVESIISQYTAPRQREKKTISYKYYTPIEGRVFTSQI